MGGRLWSISVHDFSQTADAFDTKRAPKDTICSLYALTAWWVHYIEGKHVGQRNWDEKWAFPSLVLRYVLSWDDRTSASLGTRDLQARVQVGGGGGETCKRGFK